MRKIFEHRLILYMYWLKRFLLTALICICHSKVAYAEFQYSNVFYSIGWVHGEHINLTARFRDVKTDAISQPIFSFTMGFDGNMEDGRFHSIRFDNRSFFIPNEVSYSESPGEFFVYPDTLGDGSFRKFYNYLDPVKQSLIEGVCEHFLDDNAIQKITSLGNQKPTIDFLRRENHKYELKNLAFDCYKETKKGFVRDLQIKLSNLGYSLGKIDGKWGIKSQKALDQYFGDRQISADSKITTFLLRKMQAELG